MKAVEHLIATFNEARFWLDASACEVCETGNEKPITLCLYHNAIVQVCDDTLANMPRCDSCDQYNIYGSHSPGCSGMNNGG